MSGLEERQLDELEERVAELLEKPWDKSTGRPREIAFREALVITCGYMRQNIIEDVWADIFDVDRGPPLPGGDGCFAPSSIRQERRPAPSSHQFTSTWWRSGYDTTSVDKFLDQIELILESWSTLARDAKWQASGKTHAAPAGTSDGQSVDYPPPARGASAIEMAEWIRKATFPMTKTRINGYGEEEVDDFLDSVHATFLGKRKPPLTAADVRNIHP